MHRVMVGAVLASVIGGTWGCVPRLATEEERVFSARSVVNVAPGSSPPLVGTYDFDLLGDAQGQACAEWGDMNKLGFRQILVDGHPAIYTAAVAGATFDSDDPLVRQAESAAVFNALSKLNGADLMFVTRSSLTSDTAEKLCATVWGQIVRLKKGPTLSPKAIAELPATMPSPSPAPGTAPPPPPAAAPAPAAQ